MNRQRYRLLFADATRWETRLLQVSKITLNNKSQQDEHCRTNKKGIKKNTPGTLSLTIDEKDIQINETKPEFEGDYTLVLFSFIKQLKSHRSNLAKRSVIIS
jgi:hypothetical protein